MTVSEYAALYISKQWPVIPLKHKSKAIAQDGFDMKSRLRFTPEDFKPDDGIGIRSVAQDPDDGIPVVITDCDCTEAEALAEFFLPPTGAMWGRGTHTHRKRLYFSSGIDKTLAFKDLTANKTFLELRAQHQDVAPPSIHPETGEILTWVEPIGDAPFVDSDMLIRAHKLLATCCMVARYYAPPGARHEWSLALAGLFRSLSITEVEALHLIARASAYAGDVKASDRDLEFRTTYARSVDDAVMGARKLADLSALSFVDTLRKLWGATESVDLERRIIELNKQYALLFMQSGDMVLLSETVEDNRPLLRFSKPTVMSLLHPEVVQVGTTGRAQPIMRPLGDAWLRHKARRFYNGIELNPNGRVGNTNYYNLWQGWAVEPKRGEWPLFRQHIDLIANGDPHLLAYILKWLAETIQHPDIPIGVALAFRGAPGTGKSTFARWVGHLFGPHFLHLDSEQRILGRFNAHLHNAIMVFADEAVWAAGKAGLGALKRMITEETIAIERKGIDTITVKSYIHMMVASNENWFVPTSFDDRRFAVLTISKKQQNNHTFFAAVHDELFKHGGLAAFLYDMLRHKSDIVLADIPDTPERRKQKEYSQSPQEAWWREALDDGVFWSSDHEYVPGPRASQGPYQEYRVASDEVYEHYARTVERMNRRWDVGSRTALRLFLHSVLDEPYPRTYQQKSTGHRFYLLPNLQTAREMYIKLRGPHTFTQPVAEAEDLF